MKEVNDLQHFIKAQDRDYDTALFEVRKGKKQSHWMWYIFPQIQGLGLSETSRFYAIKNIEEAKAYLDHPMLGKRLIEVSGELLTLPSNDANEIFGSPDDMKLKSSMTLFSCIEGADPIFQGVLDKFFAGNKDDGTLRIIAL